MFLVTLSQCVGRHTQNNGRTPYFQALFYQSSPCRLPLYILRVYLDRKETGKRRRFLCCSIS